MAQIDLGKLKFTWKGTWSTASAYEVDDVVYYEVENGFLNYLKSGDYDIRFLGTDYLKGNYTGKDIPIDIVWLNRNHNYSSTHLKAEIYNSVKYRKDRDLRFD